MADNLGADPALVPAASNPQAVSTKGFDPGEFDCPYGIDRFDELQAWHAGYRAGIRWVMEGCK